MVAHAFRCDHERLKRLLDGDLPEADQSEVTMHLEHCGECQTRLQSLAADEVVWREMKESLSSIDDADVLPATDASWVDPIPLDFLAPSDNPAMLGRIGEFEILEPVGCGGMGIVLKGYDHELNRYVAVKVLHPHCATSAGARQRFAREAQAAAAVVNPHVVAIHAVDGNHYPPYLVMPFVPGESLQHRLARLGPMDVIEVLRIGQQVAEGLAAAHAQGLVHRDIKPGNILLERNVDRVLLTDFGLARAADDASLTQSGVIAGTPQFMSPEQASGHTVDHRTDLFSLGTVLYTLLAGHSPFRSETAMGVLRRVCEDTPRPLRELNPTVPAWLDAFIARLHAKQPSDRFESADQVAELLQGGLAHLQQPSIVPLPGELAELSRMPAARRLVTAITAAACLVIVALGLAWWVRLPALTPSTTQAIVPHDSNAWNDADAQEVISIQQAVERLEHDQDF